jgi:regulator of RNase E activity RraA
MSDKPLPEIVKDIERVSADVVKKASQFKAAILADVAGRRGTMNGRIAPIAAQMKLCGPAYTVEVRGGDNLMIHTAITLAKPGDILVIDGKVDRTCALMGAIMINACRQLKLGGVVMDGAARDTLELRDLGFPVFCVGANPNGPTKFIPGRINHPISCGGISVQPGDLIVGDADGVVVVERGKAASLLDAAQKKVDDETARIANIQQGKGLRPKWLDESLRAAGLLKEGETL